MRFPAAGKVTDVAEWLRDQSFEETVIVNFVKWDAGAMLGASEAVIERKAGDDCERLSALLSRARGLCLVELCWLKQFTCYRTFSALNPCLFVSLLLLQLLPV